MVRTDNDTWDLASSVGATATMVAAARAMASRADDPLIDDPFAEPLVRAVGVDVLTRLATGDLPAAELGGDATVGMARMADNMAVRTVFFDEFFLDATGAAPAATSVPEPPQAVILASGLDSRAYRLPWPPGTVVFEIDQPEVIEFKTRTLADLGAEPTASRRTVAIDLRDDWPAALKAAGFDPAKPTAWSRGGTARVPARRRAGQTARHDYRAQRPGQPARDGEFADSGSRRPGPDADADAGCRRALA